MTTIDKVIIKKQYENYSDALEDMTNQGVKHLGWINDPYADIPAGYTFTKVYSNYRGTSCLYCDVIHRVSFSVDMGD